MRILFFIALILSSSLSFPQVKVYYKKVNHQALRSAGDIPKDFLVSVQEKYNQQKNDIPFFESRQIRLAQLQFYIESNFWISDLLLSGKLLYGEMLSIYVGHVADKLLAGSPELRKQLQFYVIKSPAANAFASDQGIIFVTLGLLAKLQTEAELAFVLAHEIIHFREKHNMSGYVERFKMMRGIGVYGNRSVHELIIQVHSYSRELENEADLMGLKIFERSNYEIAAVEGVLDILAFASLPIGNQPFKVSYLESGAYRVPPAWIPDSSYDALPVEQGDIEFSTHPAIEKRRELLLKALPPSKDTGSAFQVSMSKFRDMRSSARMELSRLYLLNKQYERAIYNSYLLKDEGITNSYLELNTAKALYGLALFGNHDLKREYSKASEGLSGNLRQIYALLDSLDMSSLTAMGTHYSWELRQKYPHNKEAKALSEAFVGELSKLRWDYSSDSSWQLFLDTEMSSLISHATFMELLDAGKLAHKKKYTTKLPQRNKKTLDLDMNRLIVMDPYLVKFDFSKQYPFDYLGAERAKLRTGANFMRNGTKLKLDLEVLQTKTLKKDETEKLYEIAILNDWSDELAGLQEHDKITVFPTDFMELETIRDKYRTNYFLWNATLTMSSPRRVNLIHYVYAAFVPPLIPVVFVLGLNPVRRLQYYTVLYDMDKNRVVHYEARRRNRGPSGSVMKRLTKQTLKRLSR